MNKTLAIVGIVVVAVIVIVAVKSGGNPEANVSPSPRVSVTATPASSVTPAPAVSASITPKVSPTAQGQTRTFSITGKQFEFSTKEIKVKKGDTVKIVFTNTEGTHDWVIDEFNARTKVIQAGKTDEVTFVADKTGTFEYYCSVGQHRQLGMKGSLIVE